MVWPFKRRKNVSSEPCAGERLKEARLAREQAEQDLKSVESLWPAVQGTADELNFQLEKNHLAERYRTALGGP
jgi:hypothetical protein